MPNGMHSTDCSPVKFPIEDQPYAGISPFFQVMFTFFCPTLTLLMGCMSIISFQDMRRNSVNTTPTICHIAAKSCQKTPNPCHTTPTTCHTTSKLLWYILVY